MPLPTIVNDKHNASASDIPFSNHPIIEEAFYTSASRRYAIENRRNHYRHNYHRYPRAQGSRNPTRNGQVIKYWSCDSEHHFIRECPKLRKSSLVELVVDCVSNTDSVKLTDIFDVAQNLPDDVWFSISNQVSEDSNPSSETIPSSIDTVMFTKLSV